MLTRGLLVAVALWLCTGAANASSFTLDGLPVGPLISGNGQLEFSNFQFFSPFSSVDPSKVTATILADGIELSGPISSSKGLKNFFVLYEVRALGADIDGASLQLDSQVDADKFGLVLSTKQILGEVKGLQHHDWRRHEQHEREYGDDSHKREYRHGKGSDRFGFGRDHLFPTDRRTLAFLKTADWEIGGGHKCFRTPFGPGCDGAIRLVEAGFDPQQSIRVIDGVTLKSWDGTATWESSINRFAVVPEPGTASLMLLGLALLARVPHRRH